MVKITTHFNKEVYVYPENVIGYVKNDDQTFDIILSNGMTIDEVTEVDKVEFVPKQFKIINDQRIEFLKSR